MGWENGGRVFQAERTVPGRENSIYDSPEMTESIWGAASNPF